MIWLITIVTFLGAVVAVMLPRVKVFGKRGDFEQPVRFPDECA
jgi:uncharacterized membrane protein YqaE (UPF0057 family)